MQLRGICILLAILLCGWRPAGAQEAATRPATMLERERAQAEMFKPAYRRYIQLIGTQGFAGLKTIITSDFNFKSDQETLTGEKAITSLTKIFPVSPGGQPPFDRFSVKMLHLVFEGDQAIVQTQEIHSYHDKGEDPESTSETWCWKQTWRKTAQGWRLALWEEGDENISGSHLPVTYIVTWTANKANASKVNKSSVKHSN